ncbi:PPC domain-containing protein [Sphingomonas sp.]|uniref:PPC domain-containing protein n=1 Tax=Sphingomonas sp. TaxID=28214 RepID=UPI003B004F71
MRNTTGRMAMIAALTLATAAHAQNRAPNRAGSQAVQIGRVTEGRLNGAETRHALRLAAGQTVRITARGRDFDAQLKLYGPTGAEPLADDDDSGGGTVAELVFQAERAGLYQIGVSRSGSSDVPSDGEQGEGAMTESSAAVGDVAYDLTVVAAPAPVVPPIRPIVPNAGQPTPVDMAQCGTGCRFTFQATEGDRLIAETSADDAEADPVLELRMGGEKIAEDDDGGESVNARIVRRIARTGTYTLVARTLGGKGKFALAVSLRQTVARPAVPIAVGMPVTGRLGADAEMNDEGRLYDGYTLHGRAGQRVVIDMASTDFDSLLLVMGDTVLGPVQIATNDDAEPEAANRTRPQSLNSRLALTFAKEGTVEIRAASLTDQGAYTLRVSEAPAR